MENNTKIVINVEYNLSNLEFGYKIEKAFKENNILIQDILSNKYRLRDLYMIPNLGRLSVNGIRYEFYKIGFIFKDDDEWTGRDQLDKLKNRIEKLEYQLCIRKKQYEKTIKSHEETNFKSTIGKIIGSQIL